VAAIDFTDTALSSSGGPPQNATLFPVVKILGSGSAQGCDVAFLEIQGAESVTPLKLSNGKTTPKRIAVIGYPLLSDLTPLICKIETDPTMLFFCTFHTAHPDIAKVKSPGTVYTTNAHDGIAVFTYSAATRGGQSGSPVIDLETLEVVGIHYCCSGSSQVDTAFTCATWHAQNIQWNEAISSSAILADKALNPFVNQIQPLAMYVPERFAATEERITQAALR
jgi:hypothetical protein